MEEVRCEQCNTELINAQSKSIGICSTCLVLNEEKEGYLYSENKVIYRTKISMENWSEEKEIEGSVSDIIDILKLEKNYDTLEELEDILIPLRHCSTDFLNEKITDLQHDESWPIRAVIKNYLCYKRSD